ncbi:hypothetical protein [Nitratiruptor sp. SB155-2]|uniref:hypothetical protein n=1 Tax=Nitratiruptor sp. (strain SB155-2) TaxID=387092 RepID=UPI0001586EA8|nr:hypothetical protein [Nitratiruptor sp. SB155-2]BAF69202.1 hypothetical protein NIS_0085 [Nitratiruptor sp. SB155-2]
MKPKRRVFGKSKENNQNLHSRGIAALFAAFGAVAFWRGSWMLMDRYLFPNNDLLSAVVSIVGGIAIILFLNYKFEDLF